MYCTGCLRVYLGVWRPLDQGCLLSESLGHRSPSHALHGPCTLHFMPCKPPPPCCTAWTLDAPCDRPGHRCWRKEGGPEDPNSSSCKKQRVDWQWTWGLQFNPSGLHAANRLPAGQPCFKIKHLLIQGLNPAPNNWSAQWGFSERMEKGRAGPLKKERQGTGIARLIPSIALQTGLMQGPIILPIKFCSSPHRSLSSEEGYA